MSDLGHKFVNVGFSSVKMVCKWCDKEEKDASGGSCTENPEFKAVLAQDLKLSVGGKKIEGYDSGFVEQNWNEVIKRLLGSFDAAIDKHTGVS